MAFSVRGIEAALCADARVVDVKGDEDAVGVTKEQLCVAVGRARGSGKLGMIMGDYMQLNRSGVEKSSHGVGEVRPPNMDIDAAAEGDKVGHNGDEPKTASPKATAAGYVRFRERWSG